MNTVFDTVIAGVTIFVAGQVVIKFILEPILEFRKVLGEISNEFLRNQGMILSANGDQEIENKMFMFSSNLLSKRQAISGYKYISYIVGLPSYSKVLAGARQLNLIGNLVQPKGPEPSKEQVDIYNAMQEIETHLNIIVSYNK